MPETVLITIDYNGEQADFELPTKIPIRNWIFPLRDAFKISFRSIRLENKKLLLGLKGKRLSEDETLENYGIFDGSILQLQLEEM